MIRSLALGRGGGGTLPVRLRLSLPAHHRQVVTCIAETITVIIIVHFHYLSDFKLMHGLDTRFTKKSVNTDVALFFFTAFAS